MPKTDYSQEWQDGLIQAEIRQRAGHRCEHCGMIFHDGTNRAVSEVNRLGKPVIGTVHHINGNKDDYRWKNLLYARQRCHLEIQATWLPGGVLPAKWDGAPVWLIERGLDYLPNPQLVLF